MTAGPTRESIDPVRVVTNRSSGKMGYRVAEVAWERGADVVLISGPVALPEPTGVRMRRVDSTEELEDAVRTELPAADVLVMAAAPADYRPSSPSDSKRSRIDGALAIPMEPTTDVLNATREARKSGSVVVGFALETGDALAKGLAKLERKDLDLIVVNDALEPERVSRRTPIASRCSAATAPGGSFPYNRSARSRKRSSMWWSRPLADEWRRYLAQQIELVGAEMVGRAVRRSGGQSASQE